MDLDALAKGIQFNAVRNMAVEMMKYRTDAAYHLVDLALRSHYVTRNDAKEIRELLDALQKEGK